MKLLDVPMTGRHGGRVNLQHLLRGLRDLLPLGRVTMLRIFHDGGCPCYLDERPLWACTCEKVDIEFLDVPKET